MTDVLQTELLSAEDASRKAHRHTASNGLQYAVLGNLDAPHTSTAEIARLAGTVPAAIAAALHASTYVFVPLALSAARLMGNNPVDAAPASVDRTVIASVATPALVEKAICHRNATIAGAEFVFLSSQLHSDRFALAFEFFINIAHDLVDVAPLPSAFADLVIRQAGENVRGETSMDAWEHRSHAFPRTPHPGPPDVQKAEQVRKDYLNAAFADAVAVYLLSLYLDFDYVDLREREYPLLAPAALAERLRAVNALYPPNQGYTFSILYRRRK